MLSLLNTGLRLKHSAPLYRAVRTFLSNSYQCQEAWDARIKAPIFQKIDYDDLYHQLDRSFQIGQRVSALDVDLFASGIDSDIYQNELEDVLFKLRLNPEAALLRERTMHAVIRYYILTGKKKELLNILSNRLNYGIFPDHYASNILIDLFLKENDSTSAAKVAVLSMLQEDFAHPILQTFSLYSCLKYLNSEDVWSPPKEPEVDEDEEEVKVRVGFIRNPYYDDHFDIVDTNHLIGKTLHMAGGFYSGPLGLSSKLIGLALHEKRGAVKSLISEILAKKTPIHAEAVSKAIEFTEKKPKQPEGEAPKETENDAVKAEKADVLASLEKASKADFLLPGELEAVASADVKKVVSQQESKDIQSILKLYKNWEKEREDDIQQELYESSKRKAVREISQIKDTLVNEEERIFFFDKEDEWDLKVEEKQKEIDILAQEQAASKKKKQIEEEYIPPEVGQRKL